MDEPTKRLEEPPAVEEDCCFSGGKIATTDWALLPMVLCELFFKSMEVLPIPIAALP